MKFSKKYSVEEIAKICGAEVVFGGNIELSGMNEVHVVEPNEITFSDHPKYYKKAVDSIASCIILNTKNIECPKEKALLYSPDPFEAFNILTRHFRPFLTCPSAISPTAEIGEGTIIQPLVFIGNHVKIGKNCIIHSNVSIYDYTIIGDNVIIQSNSVIGGDAYYFQNRPDGFHKFESSGRTILEDDVEIGALCAVDKGVTADTIIGKGTKLDNFVQIGHDSQIGKHCLVGSHCAIAGVTIIEDNVLLWGQVMVNKDLVIGKGAVVLATSAVDKSLEGGKVYFGAPAIEARKKWKELAALKNLPDLMEKIENLLKR